MAESVATSQMATMPSTSSFSNLITAEIRVENLSAELPQPVEQSATISVPTSSSQQSSEVDASDEPEKKRPKLERSKKLEKLENRLGGILCCAVCLDLPRAAMYQVGQAFNSFLWGLESVRLLVGARAPNKKKAKKNTKGWKSRVEKQNGCQV